MNKKLFLHSTRRVKFYYYFFNKYGDATKGRYLLNLILLTNILFTRQIVYDDWFHYLLNPTWYAWIKHTGLKYKIFPIITQANH